MSIDHPRKQIEAILLGQWEKNWLCFTKDVAGANDTAVHVFLD